MADWVAAETTLVVKNSFSGTSTGLAISSSRTESYAKSLPVNVSCRLAKVQATKSKDMYRLILQEENTAVNPFNLGISRREITDRFIIRV